MGCLSRAGHQPACGDTAELSGMGHDMARGKYATAGGSRRLRRLLALTMMVPAMAALSIAPAQAGGNTGTIKVHAEGSPSGTESNEPQVCTFNIEAFGFDEGFDGYIEFDVQGGDGPTGVEAGPFVVGPADAEGFFATDYFNTATGPVIQDGHYKVTLYGKFNGAIDYEDEKAKSKVFKVDCPDAPPPTPATPAVATASDVCEPATGPTNDRVAIPTDANFTYTLDGSAVAAGSIVATGTSHVVRAVAKEGVVVAEGAETEWTFTFTKVLCVTSTPPVTPTTPTTPTPTTIPTTPSPDVLGVSAARVKGAVKKIDKCGRAADAFWAKKVKGVTYRVKGGAIREGAWLRARTQTVKVRAVASSARYTVAGQDVWTLRFTNKPCATPPRVLPATGA